MMADAEAVPRARSRTFRFLVAICFLLVGLASYSVAQSGKRLILRDGSWQDFTQYEVRADRVRYFSSQRGEWEELPKELVDWEATEEWNEGLKKPSPELRQFDADDEALTAAPGLELPTVGGVFVLDTFSGQPSLDELAQNAGKLANDASSNIFHAPINRKGTIREHFELKGPHAHVQAHVPLPEIFVHIDDVHIGDVEPHTQQIAAGDRFRILRLEPQEDSRILARVTVSLLGKQRQSQQIVSTRIESFSQGWLKLVPLAALEPGEYAVVEMLGPDVFNLYAWDFGVDPNAPANPSSRKPESPANDRPADFSPELEPRKK